MGLAVQGCNKVSDQSQEYYDQLATHLVIKLDNSSHSYNLVFITIEGPQDCERVNVSQFWSHMARLLYTSGRHR